MLISSVIVVRACLLALMILTLDIASWMLVCGLLFLDVAWVTVPARAWAML